MAGGNSLPFEVVNGAPGYINLLDALNAWQLVKELKAATGMAAAASFKHVSPAGAAIGVPLDDRLRQVYFTGDGDLSPLASAYARARGADRVSSFGDWIGLSDVVDESTARLIRREVSDGVVAPGFSDEALELLSQKQGGRYCMLTMDAAYSAPEEENREVFGVTMAQRRNDAVASSDDLRNVVTDQNTLPPDAQRDLLVALATLKYTQSNSMCLAIDGQVIGVGAGQQSRIHCTRLAADKADRWWLRQHPRTLVLRFADGLGRPERDNAIDGFLRDDLSPVEQRMWEQSFGEIPRRLTVQERRDWLGELSGVALASDAFIPFRDNIDRAAMSGVSYVVQPGGSVRDEDVIAACNTYDMAMAISGTRLFHH